MPIPGRATLLPIPVCLLLLTGCGGGSSAPPPQPISLTTFQAAAVVIGQADFSGKLANQGGAAAANTVSSTVGAPAQGSLYLADQANNRVLGFATVPASNDAGADFVLGQTGFTGTTGGVSATSLSGPLSTVTAGGKLFVTEGGNSRVLIWNALPTADDTPADVAVGAVDLDTAGAGGATQTTLSNPIGLAVAAGHLFVTDQGMNRVMIWNTIPTSSNTPADVVLGQPDFVSFAAATTDSGLSGPGDVWSDGTRVAVADTMNNRVLIWNTLPTVNGQAADVVVGQPDFTTATAGSGAQGLNGPFGVFSNGPQLFVADTGNHRVLVYDTFPTADQPSADEVIGQSDFAHVTRDDDNQDDAPDIAPSARTLSSPIGVNVFGNRLFVASNSNNRVLVYPGN
jgi:hypothetical protein